VNPLDEDPRPQLERIRQSYDTLAEVYSKRIAGELAGKPLDRQLLQRFADRVKDRGEICDLGCGPGHVARFLKDIGAHVFGIDLSPRSITEAKRTNPDIRFRIGNMLALEISNRSLAGIAAFYSIVNLPRNTFPRIAHEMFRVLKPEGILLLAFHIGNEITHYDELWDLSISLDLVLYDPGQVKADLEEAGFVVEEVLERDPYPEVEHPSRRAYISARRP
jgi:SAM-dependent methyltransferase